MKKLTSAALLVGAALVACQSASAQAVANDLYFGFQNQAGGGTSDYIINLGAASGIVGQSLVVDLSSDFSLADFNAVLGSSTSLYGGVIGAANASTSGQANTADVYATVLRSGAGTPSAAGSTAPAGLTRQQDNNAYSGLGTLFSPTAGTGGLDANKTWESDVEPANTSGNFLGVTGLNPDSAIGTSSVLYEDLWYTSSSSLSGTKPFVYEGYFTLDLTGSQPLLTFTGVSAVPEPATYALLSGAGLLMLVLRRRWTGGIA